MSFILQTVFPGDITVDGITVGRGGGAEVSNTAVGVTALNSNTTGTQCSAFGFEALFSNTLGVNNTSVGHTALSTNSIGTDNTAVGTRALLTNDIGDSNTAVGHEALFSVLTSENTAVGRLAASTVDYGSKNTAIGAQALQIATSGSLNTVLGYGAGSAILDGEKHTLIGAYTGNSGGLDIRGSSNFVVLSDGDANIRQVIDSSGNVGIGTVTPTTKLDVNGGGAFTTATLSSNLTLNGGTANGVLFLNGSKVASSGSALTFNGTNIALNNDGYLIFASPDATIEEKSRLQWIIEDGSEMNSIRVNRLDAFANSSMEFFTRGGGPSQRRYFIGQDGTSIWSTGGSERMRISDDGTFRVKGAGTAGSTDAVQFSGSAPASAMSLDSSGRLLIGITSNLSGGLVQTSINGTGTSFLTNSAVYSALSTVAGREMPMIYASDSVNSGLISSLSGNMAFFTQATERMRLDSSGNLLVGTTTTTANGGVVQVSNGITFPATQNASSNANTLDDYEEGTVAGLTATPDSGTVTLDASSTIKYTKIGNRVFYNGFILVSSVSSPSGNIFFTGSFPSAGPTTAGSVASIANFNSYTGFELTIRVQNTQSVFYLQKTPAATGNLEAAASLLKAGSTFEFQIAVPV